MFGLLKDLIGEWEGSRGWSIIAVPKGNAQDGSLPFKLLVNNYFETLEFVSVDEPIPNKGGLFDQCIATIKYTQNIHDFDSKKLIHIENGMFMHLDNIYKTTETPETYTPQFSYARSATIPHGNSLLALGSASQQSGSPHIPDVSSHPFWEHSQEELKNFIPPYTEEQDKLTIFDIVTKMDSKIFNVHNPSENLQRDNNGLDIIETTEFFLDTNNQGGIGNIPFITSFANTLSCYSYFWLEKIKLPMSGEYFNQLQYLQVINLELPHSCQGDKKIIFPHITINTMRKK